MPNKRPLYQEGQEISNRKILGVYKIDGKYEYKIEKGRFLVKEKTIVDYEASQGT